MAVLQRITVGDVHYCTTDEIPTHIAPKGSIAIVISEQFSNTLKYINNDGGTVWLKIIEPSYGQLSLNNGTTGVEADGTQVLGSWYAFNATDTWTIGEVLNFEFQTTDDLLYTGGTKIRALIRQESTMIGGSAKWINWEVGTSLNFTVPTRYQECFSFDNDAIVSVGATRINEFSVGDFVVGGISPVSREGGGPSSQRTYIPRYCQLTITKLDEAVNIIIFNEGFESSGFTENNWTVVNNTENIWVVGQAENNGGTSSAYISNDGGVSATYNINNTQVSHFYKDITFAAGASASLVFDWKCEAENAAGATQYDYGCVVVAATGTTPAAGAEVSTVQAAAGGNGRIGAVANLGKFNLAYGTTPGTVWNTETIDMSAYEGQTKRLIFTWKNDGSVGTNPPFVIDNIRVEENIW